MLTTEKMTWVEGHTPPVPYKYIYKPTHTILYSFETYKAGGEIEMVDFTRKELQDISDKASKQANIYGTSTVWKRVYEQLESAASALDAFMARTEIKGKLN